MRILFNAPNPKLHGGPPTHLPLLEKKLKELLDLHPFQYGRKSDTETTMDKVTGRFSDLVSAGKLINSVKPDLIHHNSAFDPRALLRDAPLAWLARRRGVPLFIKIHGSLPEGFTDNSLLTRKSRQTVVRNTTAFGVLSHAELEEFEENFPELKGRVFIVKNILKPEFYEIERHESEKPVVLFISRCMKRKGIFDLLDAAPIVTAKFPETQFICVGDGPDAAEFDRQVREKGLAGTIQRLAHVDNRQTREFYSRAWVFAFPTYYPEGMPMVVAEAMAAGVPLVTTRTRFSRSYMEEGTHCLYTEYGDAQSIAEKILMLIENEEVRKKMSRSNMLLAQQFSADTVAREFIEIYKKICAA